jgi:hypothetical protein
MLKETVETTWGFQRANDLAHALYRVAKAAAKHKQTAELTRESTSWTQDLKDNVSGQMIARWHVDPGDWTEPEIARALPLIRANSRSFHATYGIRALHRRFMRVIQPTGLLMCLGKTDIDPDELAEILSPAFRKTRVTRRIAPAAIFHLIRSTLIVCTDQSTPRWLPNSLIFSVEDFTDMENVAFRILHFLEHRCAKRELR